MRTKYLAAGPNDTRVRGVISPKQKFYVLSVAMLERK